MKRTKVDFSGHILKVTKTDDVLIHDFRKPDSIIHRVVFINAMGVMSVTGDFGNWIFCREFHPSADGHVSGSYWDEKLEISSVQQSKKYDPETTVQLINDYRTEYVTEETSEAEQEWLQEIENNSDDELNFLFTAYRGKPSDVDYESVPIGKIRHPWLNVVYDAFDEICERIKTQENGIF